VGQGEEAVREKEKKWWMLCKRKKLRKKTNAEKEKADEGGRREEEVEERDFNPLFSLRLISRFLSSFPPCPAFSTFCCTTCGTLSFSLRARPRSRKPARAPQNSKAAQEKKRIRRETK
jgi:hypothetical protein